jgi:hypothetical protein
VDVISSHQLEEEIGAASSENGLFIAKMEFSVWAGKDRPSPKRLRTAKSTYRIELRASEA